MTIFIGFTLLSAAGFLAGWGATSFKDFLQRMSAVLAGMIGILLLSHVR